MGNLNTAYQWAIDKCNDSKVGYSQSYRNERTVNGITYYDCSSFIWYALMYAGFDVETVHGSTWPFTTYDMCPELLTHGFVEVPITGEWRAGDIVWRTEHVEFVHTGLTGGGYTMGAHTDSYELLRQVSINGTPSYYGSWERLFRYGGGVTTYEWIYGNRYLTTSETLNNACIVYSYFSARGWTRNAIAGLLGNMERESGINPAIWESLIVGAGGGGGYGLVGWTPWTNYTNWADSKGYEWTDGYGQCEWIDTQTTVVGQWIPTAGYNLTFEEFKQSEQSPQWLASAFMRNFERPGVLAETDRRNFALKWYNYFENFNPFEPNTPRKKRKQGYNFLLFNHNRRMKEWTNKH